MSFALRRLFGAEGLSFEAIGAGFGRHAGRSGRPGPPYFIPGIFLARRIDPAGRPGTGYSIETCHCSERQHPERYTALDAETRMEVGGGLQRRQIGFYLSLTTEAKKEEFPGRIMKMIPGNSFPQICFVAVNESVEIAGGTQGHGGSTR